MNKILCFPSSSADSGPNRVCVEDFVEQNFLVTPETVGKRKTAREKDGRVVDHKLQVLYRVELHWLLASSEKQRSFERDILLHLRQIGIWASSREQNAFLSDCVVPTYINSQVRRAGERKVLCRSSFKDRSRWSRLEISITLYFFSTMLP